MWLVVCAANDFSALWAARELARRGLQPLEIVTAEALAYCRRFIHRLGTGRVSTEISLADGRIIDSAVVRGTLNRLQNIPSQHLARAPSADRQYAEQELFALYMSWLHGLPGVMVNRPTPRGLSGEWRSQPEWIWLAARAGLQTVPYLHGDHYETHAPQSSRSIGSRTIIAIKGVHYSTVISPAISNGCDRLLELCGSSLLGIEFDTNAGQWIFKAATPFPDLRLGGDGLIDALLAVLTS
jgi:hypothetical protein